MNIIDLSDHPSNGDGTASIARHDAAGTIFKVAAGYVPIVEGRTIPHHCQSIEEAERACHVIRFEIEVGNA